MTQTLYTVEEVSAMIHDGKKMLLAGDAGLLSQLPKGDWIGGSTPYFILYPEQMVESHEKLFVNCLPDFVETVEMRCQGFVAEVWRGYFSFFIFLVFFF